jgi:soluble lytic murein transglycosylase-like protein
MFSRTFAPAARHVPGIGRYFLKVRRLFDPSSLKRAFAGVVITSLLAAGGVAAPMAARAEAIPSAQPSVDASTSVTPTTTVEASVTAAPSAVATPAAAAAPAVKKAVKKKKLSVRAQVVKTGRKHGLSKKELAALLWIAKRESNFNPRSVSSAQCKGVFQLSKSMSRGHPWWKPAWNTTRAIKYMRGRYGGVLKAKAFWTRHHWY